MTASNEEAIGRAFETLAQAKTSALLVLSEPFFSSQREKIVTLAARHAIPTIYGLREYAIAGGLMIYGTSISDAYRQVGVYAGRILKGEKGGRPAGGAVHQIRAGHQPQDENARPYHTGQCCAAFGR